MPDNWDGVGERYGSAVAGPGGPLCKGDVHILRELGQRKAEAAAHPQNAHNRARWQAANDLQMQAPPVFIDEVCWNEADPDGETRPRCANPWAARLEQFLRRELFLWEKAPACMVVSGFIECPMAVQDSGFGIDEVVDIARTDADNDVVSRQFHRTIESIDDLAALHPPDVQLDEAQTEANLSALREAFEGVLDVRLTGARGLWFTPWDYLVRVTGVEEALMNLVLEPEFLDALVSRYVDMAMLRLERYSALGLWASNNCNIRVGSGGYGYTSELPKADGLPANAPTKALWGCGNAQIFSEVSPKMHWEFSLRHELRWLSQFGLTYYGCCEPLHNKLDILQRIPNLRKISMSPWAKLPQAAEMCGKRYVLSCKPNPAIFAAPTWDAAAARADIARILRETEGCNIEIVMKDISTIRHDPARLFEWAKIAGEMTR